jgi:hypothetical protein
MMKRLLSAAALLLCLVTSGAAAQAPDSIKAGLDDYWHPFLQMTEQAGQALAYHAYRLEEGEQVTIAYRVFIQGQLIHTVFRREGGKGACYEALPGDLYAHRTSCQPFSFYHRNAASMWPEAMKILKEITAGRGKRI